MRLGRRGVMAGFGGVLAAPALAQARFPDRPLRMMVPSLAVKRLNAWCALQTLEKAALCFLTMPGLLSLTIAPPHET